MQRHLNLLYHKIISVWRMRNLKMYYVINAVYILLAINITLFLVVLLNKILGKIKKREKLEKINLYRNIISDYVQGESTQLPKIKDREDRSLFKTILLEAFDNSDPVKESKLLEISRKMGIIKYELESLKRGNKPRKAIAAYRLGKIGAVEAIDELLKNIDIKNQELSYIIFRSLVLLSGTEYLDKIIDYLGNDDFTIKAKVLDLISIINNEDIYPKMKEYLEGSNILERVIAFESLSKRGDRRIIPYIKEAVNSEEKEIKISGLKAIIATNSLDCDNVCPMIVHLRDDSDWEVRAFFAKSLSICSHCKNAINMLKEMTEDSNYLVRFNSSEKLFEMGELGLIALSEVLSSDDNYAVDKVWSLINREMTLYNLMDKIKDYASFEYILKNIEDYQQSITGGDLVNA